MIRTKAPEGTTWFLGRNPQTYGDVQAIMLFSDEAFLDRDAMRLFQEDRHGHVYSTPAPPLATEKLEVAWLRYQWYIEMKARKVKRRYLEAQRYARRRERDIAKRDRLVESANSHLKVESSE